MEEELNLVRADLTRESYVGLLERFWGFYQPLELRLLPTLEASWPGAFLSRTKTAFLRHDLRELGHDEASIALLPRADRLPNCGTAVQALGVAYVLEGSTLGGKVLSRHFRTLLGIDTHCGGSFFSCYGDAVDVQWQQFCMLLNDFDIAHPHESEPVIAAAGQTFACLYDWLCVPGQVGL